jgi:hypothetical protein
VSVSQQTQADLANQVYLRNFIAALLQRQAEADANRAASTNRSGTNIPTGASVSPQGAKTAAGTTQYPPTGGSGAASDRSSGNPVNVSLVASKSGGPLVPALILGLVLAICLLAIEVRRRNRRAVGASVGDDGAVSNGD